MTEQDKPEKSLAIRSQETSLARTGSSPHFLAVGLTPQFFENLGKANAAIVRAYEVTPKTPASVSMVLVPGESPIVETTFKSVSGLRIYVNSEPRSATSRPKPTTEIKVVDESTNPRSIVVLLSEIQEFVKKIFPDENMVLHATPYPGLVEKPESINSDLNSVTQEMLQSTFVNGQVQVRVEGEVVTRSLRFLFTGFEVRASGSDKPNVTFRPLKENYDPRVSCAISELYFVGESEQAEKALVAMTDLINRSYEELLPGVKDPLQSGMEKSLTEGKGE